MAARQQLEELQKQQLRALIIRHAIPSATPDDAQRLARGATNPAFFSARFRRERRMGPALAHAQAARESIAAAIAGRRPIPEAIFGGLGVAAPTGEDDSDRDAQPEDRASSGSNSSSSDSDGSGTHLRRHRSGHGVGRRGVRRELIRLLEESQGVVAACNRSEKLLADLRERLPRALQKLHDEDPLRLDPPAGYPPHVQMLWDAVRSAWMDLFQANVHMEESGWVVGGLVLRWLSWTKRQHEPQPQPQPTQPDFQRSTGSIHTAPAPVGPCDGRLQGAVGLAVVDLFGTTDLRAPCMLSGRLRRPFRHVLLTVARSACDLLAAHSSQPQAPRQHQLEAAVGHQTRAFLRQCVGVLAYQEPLQQLMCHMLRSLPNTNTGLQPARPAEPDDDSASNSVTAATAAAASGSLSERTAAMVLEMPTEEVPLACLTLIQRGYFRLHLEDHIVRALRMGRKLAQLQAARAVREAQGRHQEGLARAARAAKTRRQMVAAAAALPPPQTQQLPELRPVSGFHRMYGGWDGRLRRDWVLKPELQRGYQEWEHQANTAACEVVELMDLLWRRHTMDLLSERLEEQLQMVRGDGTSKGRGMRSSGGCGREEDRGGGGGRGPAAAGGGVSAVLDSSTRRGTMSAAAGISAGDGAAVGGGTGGASGSAGGGVTGGGAEHDDMALLDLLLEERPVEMSDALKRLAAELYYVSFCWGAMPVVRDIVTGPASAASAAASWQLTRLLECLQNKFSVLCSDRRSLLLAMRALAARGGRTAWRPLKLRQARDDLGTFILNIYDMTAELDCTSLDRRPPLLVHEHSSEDLDRLLSSQLMTDHCAVMDCVAPTDVATAATATATGAAGGSRSAAGGGGGGGGGSSSRSGRAGTDKAAEEAAAVVDAGDLLIKAVTAAANVVSELARTHGQDAVCLVRIVQPTSSDSKSCSSSTGGTASSAAKDNGSAATQSGAGSWSGTAQQATTRNPAAAKGQQLITGVAMGAGGQGPCNGPSSRRVDPTLRIIVFRVSRIVAGGRSGGATRGVSGVASSVTPYPACHQWTPGSPLGPVLVTVPVSGVSAAESGSRQGQMG